MDLNQKLQFNGLFWDKRVCGSQTPPTNWQILLPILHPVTNTEILEPEMVGDQSEMMV